MKKRLIAAVTAAIVAVTSFALPVTVSAKTHPDGQVVGTTLFYVKNSSGERVLVSQIPIATLEADMKAGKIDNTLHNYSILDRYVTTVHQEAQGFTAGEYVKYAQSKSSDADMKAASLSFEGNDKMVFWEMDDVDYDDADTYTYDQLYGVQRYNFPMLYKYWNYKTQDYYDPDGKMSRDQVIQYIWDNRQPETFILAVRSFSQRYMVTDEKYGEKDYAMENYWQTRNLLDNERAVRMMVGMTEDELKNATPTASNTRYWIQSTMLDMQKAPSIKSKGTVATPTAVVTDDDNYYYIKLSCATDGATIYYNSNFRNPSYMPSMDYDGQAVKIEKSLFPDGKVTLTVHAVKDGYTDTGVQTLTLTSSGKGNQADSDGSTSGNSKWNDISDGAWYSSAVSYVTDKNLFDSYGKATGGTDNNAFGPLKPMTRQMLVTALYRMAGSPSVSGSLPFNDVASSAAYRNAVLWAYTNDIVKGTSSSSFSPDKSVTREQITALFSRYAKFSGADTSKSGDISSFKDAASVSSWALTDVKWAVAAGVINGNADGTLNPKGTATRAQMAQIIMNYMK